MTTPEIAASFVTGMEYFNTFGGNPVSAEIGLAVLDVIRDERLQAHALAMGVLLSVCAGSLGLDVRGLGLFLGVPLDSRERRRALQGGAGRPRQPHLHRPGPNDDVLKIKAALVLSEAGWRLPGGAGDVL